MRSNNGAHNEKSSTILVPAEPMSMSDNSTKSEDDLTNRVTNFLQRNFPQIQMHGGNAAIEYLDEDSGEVHIQLGGACSGCGISPMTIQAIKRRMVKEIPEINKVQANTGQTTAAETDTSPSLPGQSDDESSTQGPDIPF